MDEKKSAGRDILQIQPRCFGFEDIIIYSIQIFNMWKNGRSRFCIEEHYGGLLWMQFR